MQIICKQCGGGGDVRVTVGGGPDAISDTMNCPDCKGVGVVDLETIELTRTDLTLITQSLLEGALRFERGLRELKLNKTSRETYEVNSAKYRILISRLLSARTIVIKD